MAKIDVLDLQGKKVGSLELEPEVFGAVNRDLLWEAVTHYRAARRAGTHATKNRALVSGSGKKLWRQKGTGRARMGSIRSPLWRHGGTVHGPAPRDYSYRLPRKMLLGALRSALSAKLRDGELTVVHSFVVPDHKTRTVKAVLDRLAAAGSVLLVDNSGDRNLSLGSRNLAGVTLLASREVTTYDLLGHQRVLLSEEAAKKLSEALAL